MDHGFAFSSTGGFLGLPITDLPISENESEQKEPPVLSP